MQHSPPPMFTRLENKWKVWGLQFEKESSSTTFPEARLNRDLFLFFVGSCLPREFSAHFCGSSDFWNWNEIESGLFHHHLFVLEREWPQTVVLNSSEPKSVKLRVGNFSPCFKIDFPRVCLSHLLQSDKSAVSVFNLSFHIFCCRPLFQWFRKLETIFNPHKTRNNFGNRQLEFIVPVYSLFQLGVGCSVSFKQYSIAVGEQSGCAPTCSLSFLWSALLRHSLMPLSSVTI